MKDAATAIVVAGIVGAVVLAVGTALAPAVVDVAGVSSIWVVAAVCLGLNLLAWVPAALGRTERFYDLVGSLTFLSVVAVVVGARVAASDDVDGLRLLPAGCVVVWTLRLGRFLVARIRRAGGDGRFDALKTSAVRFFVPWTLQGLWVFLTSLAMVVQVAGDGARPASAVATTFGTALWLVGFVVEVVADRQKTAFAADAANRGRFVTTGLWAWSRHPNYFGEMLLWLGVFLMGTPSYVGAQWLAAVSPVFVFVLLRFVSGVPLLERRADARWGDDPAYVAWRDATPLLLPLPPRRRGS